MNFEEFLTESSNLTAAQMGAAIKKAFPKAKVHEKTVTFNIGDMSPSEVRSAVKKALPGTWHQSSRKMPGDDIEFIKPFDEGKKVMIIFHGKEVAIEIGD